MTPLYAHVRPGDIVNYQGTMVYMLILSVRPIEIESVERGIDALYISFTMYGDGGGHCHMTRHQLEPKWCDVIARAHAPQA